MEYKIKANSTHIEDVKADGIVTIAISRFNTIDKADDIVRKGAFTKTFKEQIHKIKHVTNHMWRMEDIVGTPLKMYENDTHAIVESKLILGTNKGRELFEMYKHFAENGSDMEHSYAYRTLKKNENPDIKGEDIAELAMKEYSTVFAGCNPDTPTLGIKSDLEAVKAITDIENLLRKGDFSDITGKNIEKIIQKLKEHSVVDEPETLIKQPEPNFTIKELETILFNKFKI